MRLVNWVMVGGLAILTLAGFLLTAPEYRVQATARLAPGHTYAGAYPGPCPNSPGYPTAYPVPCATPGPLTLPMLYNRFDSSATLTPTPTPTPTQTPTPTPTPRPYPGPL